MRVGIIFGASAVHTHTHTHTKFLVKYGQKLLAPLAVLL